MGAILSRESGRTTDKRERILRAAIEVFARKGYFSAKVSEVAREAGVADGTIYLYFDGKEDILLTIFREHSRRFLDGLLSRLAGVSDPREQIRRIIRFHFDTFASDRSLAIVFQVELRHSQKFITELTQGEVGEYLNLLRRVVEEGQAKGKFRKSIAPQIVANSIFGIVDEIVTSWILSDREQLPSEVGDQVCEFVIAGLG
jgi:TetR/AcrR family transcriptional regulator, fatty acid metabolism regulator protein